MPFNFDFSTFRAFIFWLHDWILSTLTMTYVSPLGMNWPHLSSSWSRCWLLCLTTSFFFTLSACILSKWLTLETKYAWILTILTLFCFYHITIHFKCPNSDIILALYFMTCNFKYFTSTGTDSCCPAPLPQTKFQESESQWRN